MKQIIFGLLAVLIINGCDTYSQDDFASEFVVEAYLIAGEPLPIVKLSETSPFDAAYRFEDVAVAGARVTISLLDEDGQAAETYTYSPQGPGIYTPELPSEIQPLRRYALNIIPPDGSEPIAASTLVPGAFTITPIVVDTLLYQSDGALELEMTHSAYPGRAAIYMNKVQALDTSYALTPLYQDLLSEDDLSKQELVDNSSGITNEANFNDPSSDLLKVTVPWIGIAFYGPNDIVVDAIDDNLYDFIRSREENGVRPLGERENTIDHITGGRGIFGSLAREKVHIFVAEAL